MYKVFMETLECSLQALEDYVNEKEKEGLELITYTVLYKEVYVKIYQFIFKLKGE